MKNLTATTKNESIFKHANCTSNVLKCYLLCLRQLMFNTVFSTSDIIICNSEVFQIDISF